MRALKDLSVKVGVSVVSSHVIVSLLFCPGVQAASVIKGTWFQVGQGLSNIIDYYPVVFSYLFLRSRTFLLP